MAIINDSLVDLPDGLINEKGGCYGFVCIWRRWQKENISRSCSVGEFLSIKENQSGTWLIDGGWGGPPGPIRVDWDNINKRWINKGFNP